MAPSFGARPRYPLLVGAACGLALGLPLGALWRASRDPARIEPPAAARWHTAPASRLSAALTVDESVLLVLPDVLRDSLRRAGLVDSTPRAPAQSAPGAALGSEGQIPISR
jgi:hypothetical protein